MVNANLKAELSVFELVDQIRWVETLELEQKLWALSVIFLGMDWHVFMNNSCAFKENPEYRYLTIIKLPSLSLLLLEWEKGCTIHRHLDLAGNPEVLNVDGKTLQLKNKVV